MKLTAAQLRLLAQGDCTSLLFPFDQGKPVQGACCVVLAWEERRRISDSLGNVTVVPARPVHWIEVTDVRRHRKGDWQVRFNRMDLRQHPRFIARGAAYTTTSIRKWAADNAEAVSEAYQDKLSKQHEKDWEKVRTDRAIAARQQWKQTKEAARLERRALDRLLAA